MNPNISCSFPGCTNPVIGQCTGYQGSCGRFYCAIHSSATLCYEHAEQKRTDEIAEKIYNDYLETASEIYGEVRTLTTISAVIFGAIGILLVLAGGQELGLLLGIGGMLIVAVYANSKQQAQVATITGEKPGFEEFYKEYSKIKGKESLKKGLAVAGALTVVALGVAAAAQQQQVRDDIRSIRSKLD